MKDYIFFALELYYWTDSQEEYKNHLEKSLVIIVLKFHWIACLNPFGNLKTSSLNIMLKQTGSTLGKGYVKAVYCHPAI